MSENIRQSSSMNEEQARKLEVNTETVPSKKDKEENSALTDEQIDQINVQLKGFESFTIEESCPSDSQAWGKASGLYSYIFKGQLSEDDWKRTGDPCKPWYHSTGQIDSLQVNTSLVGQPTTDENDNVVSGPFSINSTVVTFGGDISVVGIISSATYGWSLGNGGYDGPVSGNVTGNLVTTSITLGDIAITATGDELNYTDGVTSNIQTQLDAKISLSTLKTEVAASTDFADFKSRIAALT